MPKLRHRKGRLLRLQAFRRANPLNPKPYTCLGFREQEMIIIAIITITIIISITIIIAIIIIITIIICARVHKGAAVPSGYQ